VSSSLWCKRAVNGNVAGIYGVNKRLALPQKDFDE